MLKRILGLAIAAGLVILVFTLDTPSTAPISAMLDTDIPSDWFGADREQYDAVIEHCNDMIERIDNTWGSEYANEVGYALWAVLGADGIRSFCDQSADRPDPDLRAALRDVEARAAALKE